MGGDRSLSAVRWPTATICFEPPSRPSSRWRLGAERGPPSRERGPTRGSTRGSTCTHRSTCRRQRFLLQPLYAHSTPHLASFLPAAITGRCGWGLGTIRFHGEGIFYLDWSPLTGPCVAADVGERTHFRSPSDTPPHYQPVPNASDQSGSACDGDERPHDLQESPHPTFVTSYLAEERRLH